MIPERRYLFDVNSSLHIPDALSETELATAREAVERYVTTPEEELPEGFSDSEEGEMHANGFAWNGASSPSSSMPSCGPASWRPPTTGPAWHGAPCWWTAMR